MNTKRLEKSLKEWKKTKNRGAIVHQAEMINEQIHIRTIRIRQCKKGMEEADRINALMKEKEIDRLEELYESHLKDKRMVNLCMKYIKKAPKYDLKEIPITPEPPKVEIPIERKKSPLILLKEKFIPPDPIDEIIKEPPKKEPPITAIPEAPYVAPPLTPEEKVAIRKIELQKEIDEIEFPCSHCGKIYATEPALKRHITMRHKEV